MSLKRSLTAPPFSSLSSLTEFPAASPSIPKRSLPTPARHNTNRPRSNSRAQPAKSSLSRVTSRVSISQEDPFNCSGFFPEQATTPAAFTTSAADWDWVRSGNDDEEDEVELEGDGDIKNSAEPTTRRSRPTVFLLDDEDGLGFSPASESLSLPITPAAHSLLSPLANEFDDEFAKRINDEDKMGVLRMTMSATRLFSNRSRSLTSIPVLLSSTEEEVRDHDGLHALISSRRLKLTTSNLTTSQSDSNLKSTLFSPVDDDNVEEWTGGERMLQMLGGYVADSVRRVVGI